jgi:hypothetical protein
LLEQQQQPDNKPTINPTHILPEPIEHLILQYKDIFQIPTTLPPHRIHDHPIPLLPGSIPVNSKPYHYSPHHKTEIEH